MSNFNYCQLLRHICGKGNNNKLEQIKRMTKWNLTEWHQLQLIPAWYIRYCFLVSLTFPIYDPGRGGMKIGQMMNASYVHDMFHINVVPYKMGCDKMNGLVQERRNSSALALELHLSCTNPLKWSNPGWKPSLMVRIPFSHTWYVWMYLCIYVCIFVCICMGICMHACLCAFMHFCTSIWNE